MHSPVSLGRKALLLKLFIILSLDMPSDRGGMDSRKCGGRFDLIIVCKLLNGYHLQSLQCHASLALASISFNMYVTRRERLHVKFA